jgi:hypothetical protein
MTFLKRFALTVDGIPLGMVVARLVLIAIQLILVICLGERGVLFFYQAF